MPVASLFTHKHIWRPFTKVYPINSVWPSLSLFIVLNYSMLHVILQWHSYSFLFPCNLLGKFTVHHFHFITNFCYKVHEKWCAEIHLSLHQLVYTELQKIEATNKKTCVHKRLFFCALICANNSVRDVSHLILHAVIYCFSSVVGEKVPCSSALVPGKSTNSEKSGMVRKWIAESNLLLSNVTTYNNKKSPKLACPKNKYKNKNFCPMFHALVLTFVGWAF